MTLAVATAGAALGVIVGSFVATLIIRWPDGRSIADGRSRCDSCDRELGVRDLVPILSWVASNGVCRTCGAAIPRTHIWVELACAALGGIALWLAPGVDGLILAAFWWQLLVLALLDARHYWLPDRLTLILALSGAALGQSIANVPLVDRLIGGAAGFVSLWLVAAGYRAARGREGLGGGDAKLLGAIGLWLGWAAIPLIVLMAALAGLSAAIARRKQRLEAMPFGTCLAAAAALWAGTQVAGWTISLGP